jgi:single-strand DNA-binding protein
MNLNKVFLIGRLTRDPEIRVMPSGQQVANFGLATDSFYTDKNTNQRQQKTEFHNIVLFGRLAEIASQYLKKGSLAMFEGRIQTRDWQDATGTKRYRTEIVADSMQLGPRSGESPASAKGYGEAKPGNTPKSTKSSNEAKGNANKEPEQEPDIPIIDESDDIDVKNIPF